MLMLAALALTAPALIQDAPTDTPDTQAATTTAKAVIDRCIEATGGRAAWDALTSIRGMGTVSLSGLPAQGRFMVSQTKEGFRMDVDMFSQGPEGAWVKVTTQSTIRNRDLTWREGEQSPPRLVTGPTRDDLLRKSTFNPLLDVDRLYSTLALEGMEEVDGTPCWKVKLEPRAADDPTELRWFSIADGLLIKLAQTPAGGGVTSELMLLDYRPVGGVLLNHVMIVSNLGASFERRFEAIQVDVTIDPCLFEPPPSIANLARDQAGRAPTTPAPAASAPSGG